MDVRARDRVIVTGRVGARPVLFAHGFGCDQNMWRLVVLEAAGHGPQLSAPDQVVAAIRDFLPAPAPAGP